MLIVTFAEIKHEYPILKFAYIDGSKKDNRVDSAAIMNRRCLTESIPDEAFIFSAEVRAILLAFKYIGRSIHNKFVICTDSLSHRHKDKWKG